jgi:hypothetical protein
MLYGAFFLAVERWGTEKVPFSKAGWQNKTDLGDRWPMAQNLVETGYLRGMTEPEVVQMLGKEDAREVHRNAESPDDLSLTYVASGRLRFGVLHISFKNGRVTSTEVTSFDFPTRKVAKARKAEEVFAPVGSEAHRPHCIAQAFTPGARLRTRTGLVSFSQEKVGDLYLPTGQIVAWDVYFTSHVPSPFLKKVAPGCHPVSVAIADFEPVPATVSKTAKAETNSEFTKAARCIAFAKVSFSSSPPVSWQTADILPWLSVPSLPGDAYSAPSGIGCFADMQTAKLIVRLPDIRSHNARILKNMSAHAQPTYDAADLLVSKGHNLVCFSTGLGPGYYPSYWGLDAEGKICALATDFRLFYD